MGRGRLFIVKWLPGTGQGFEAARAHHRGWRWEQAERDEAGEMEERLGLAGFCNLSKGMVQMGLCTLDRVSCGVREIAHHLRALTAVRT